MDRWPESPLLGGRFQAPGQRKADTACRQQRPRLRSAPERQSSSLRRTLTAVRCQTVRNQPQAAAAGMIWSARGSERVTVTSTKRALRDSAEQCAASLKIDDLRILLDEPPVRVEQPHRVLEGATAAVAVGAGDVPGTAATAGYLVLRPQLAPDQFAVDDDALRSKL